MMHQKYLPSILIALILGAGATPVPQITVIGLKPLEKDDDRVCSLLLD